MFDTLEMSLTVLERLAPLEPKLRQRRKSLADEVGRAAESIALNVSEARQRAGLDRADLFRRLGKRAHHGAAHRAGTRLHHAR
jgi:ribosome-binding protein aMBF1 (putative translation factor)